MAVYWVLWFVITTFNGVPLHIPVEAHYATKDACEADLPEWKETIVEQFPGDPNLRVYCEEHNPDNIKEL